MLGLCDLSTEAGAAKLETILNRLRGTASASSDAAAAVARIVTDVAGRGDAAVVDYMRQWTDPAFDAQRIRVSRDELASASALVDQALLGSIDRAIEHVRVYQQHVRPVDPEPVVIDGAQLGLRWTPMDSAGLYVPGGTAVLFSTLIMLAVPALVAGVPAEKISVVSPPPTRVGDEPAGDISPVVLATAHRLGIDKVYRLGGGQAVAALAYGTETVEPVDIIAGPGNVFVQLAKAQVSGKVGTDNGFYGPSEIVTVADASADPRNVAADLLAQAEHNPGKCFLVVWDKTVLAGILKEVQKQFPQRSRGEAIKAALSQESAAILARDQDHAVDIANTIACEHVNLAVADPKAMLERIRHAGEVFLGDSTPVASGDYYAGPSHCLPTGTTARFTSGVSCHTFLKRTGTVAYPQGMPRQAMEDVARMADAEGLDGHAASARVRRQ